MSTSLTTLHDLLRFSFTETVTWLRGEAGVKRPVRWVVISLEEVQPDDVLLWSSDRCSAEVLDQAQQCQAAAVILLGKDPPPEVDRLDDLRVVSVPEFHGDLRSLQRAMLTMLINQRTALMERGARIHAQLSELEAEGKGLDGLAQAMSAISGRGILLQDKRGRLLAEYPAAPLLSIWHDVLEQLTGLASLPEALQDRKRARGHATIIPEAVPGGLERLVTPITVGEMARGYLSLVGLSGELDTLDQLVAEQGAMVCAVEMARNKAVREAEKRLKGDLLTALLLENLSPRDARLWLQAMEMDLDQAHVSLRFSWDVPASSNVVSAPSRRRLETLVNGEVTLRGLKAIVNPMGTEVICFCQVPPDTGKPDMALALGQAILDQGAREFPEIPVRCGVGKPALELDEWRSSFQQAGQALEMARRLAEFKPLFYSDLSVYRLLFQLEQNPELIAFQEEILGPLLAHESAEELLHTLSSYFEYNGNLSQTAEALFVHRNTLIYRMERIARITQLNLDKPENRLAVQLALHIYDMRGHARSRG